MKKYIRSNLSTSIQVVPYYTESRYGGFVKNTSNHAESLDQLISDFHEVSGDIDSRYCTLCRQSNISRSYFTKLIFSDDLNTCKTEAVNWLDQGTNSVSREFVMEMHYYADVIDTVTGDCIYWGDVWENNRAGWEYNL